jgi:hypothetical protein
MPDQIDFTPKPTALDPTPGAEIFVPTTVGALCDRFGFFEGGRARRVNEIIIPDSDFAFTSYDGAGFKRYEVKGTDTFSTHTAAETQLAKLYKMIGAECSIQSVSNPGTFVAVGVSFETPPIIETMFFPGYYINYSVRFAEAL